MDSAAPIVGIDLGTTFSAAGIFQDGAVSQFANPLGHTLTPSVVALDPRTSGLVVGRAAKDILAANPAAAVATFKRAMGTERLFTLGERKLSAVELSAYVLDALKADAERSLNSPVTRCVVTVPAYFNDAQRTATKRAAQLAGFYVDRVLNEPTAAAIAYGLDHAEDESRFLVFDLGGGTFDVCVMELFEGMLRVESVAGESNLGGEDFTEALCALALARTDVSADRAANYPDSRSLLYKRCEILKRKLTSWPHATLVVPRFDGSDGGREIEVSSEEAERAWMTLISRLRGPCRTALRLAKVDAGALDAVVLVGGATRMPCVRRFVTELLGREPMTHGDPDHVVAHGAAIQAALCADDAAVGDLVVTDVASHSLGMAIGKRVGHHVLGGYFLPVIHRGTVIPTSRTKSVSPIEAGQTKLTVQVYEGDARRVGDNVHIGDLEVRGVPASPERNAVEVTFTYDLNGLLEVQARIPSTGDTFQRVFQRREVKLDGRALEQALERIRHFRSDPRERPRYREALARADLLWKECSPDVQAIIERGILALEHALAERDLEAMEAACDELAGLCEGLDGGERW